MLKNGSSARSNAPVQQQGNLGQAVQMAAVNPGALTSGNIAQLQKTLGNKAVTQLLSQHTVQKKGNSPEEEEPLQGKFNTVQKKGPEEEEPLQGKFETIQKAAEEEEEVQT